MGFTLYYRLQPHILIFLELEKKAPAYGGGFLMVIKAVPAVRLRVLE